MNKNLIANIDNRIKRLEEIFREQEKRIGEWEKDNPEKNSYFSVSKQKSAKLMSLVLGRTADPLSEVDIKDFNKKIFSQAFNLTDPNEQHQNEKEDLYQSARWYLTDNRAIKEYSPKMKEQLRNHWNKWSEPVKEAIQMVLSEEAAGFIQNTFIETVNDKTKTKPTKKYSTTGKEFVKKVNLQIKDSKYMLREDLGDFKITDANSKFIVTPTLTKNGLTTSRKEIIKPFLKNVSEQIGTSTPAKRIANEYLKNKEALDQFNKTFIDYNTTVYSDNLFFGFWGESILGSILQNLVIENTNSQIKQKVEQIGNKTFDRETKNKKNNTGLLPQAPADVLLKINGKEYSFQAKQWSLKSFAGNNSKVKPLGTRTLNYCSFSKNWEYFYNENTWTNIIKIIEGDEKSKHNLFSTPENTDKIIEHFNYNPSNFFKHLTLGSFNFETQLPYKKTIMAGNDFFYLSGRFIPSVFLLKQFLQALKTNVNPLITLERQVYKKNFNYMRVVILGLKMDLNHIANKTAFNF